MALILRVTQRLALILLKFSVFGFCLFLCSSPAFAITINDEAGSGAAIELGELFTSVAELRFSNDGGGYGLCSGSLISSTTILTAQHCTSGYTASSATATFQHSGSSYSYDVSRIFSLSGYTGNIQTGTDISVLELATPVTDLSPYAYTNEFIVGETARFVGYGLNGTGSAGHENTRDGERWAAENTIDAYSVGDSVSGNNFLYYSDFDNPDGTSNSLFDFNVTSSGDMLEFEGSTAGGDSGGPLFVDRNGEWVIAGVLSGGLIGGSLPSDSSYGAISFWTGLYSTEAQALITDVGGASLYSTNPTAVPEINGNTVPLLAFILGVIGLGLRGRSSGTTTAVPA